MASKNKVVNSGPLVSQAAIGGALLQLLVLAIAFISVVESPLTAPKFLSIEGWKPIVNLLGGSISTRFEVLEMQVPLFSTLLLMSVLVFGMPLLVCFVSGFRKTNEQNFQKLQQDEKKSQKNQQQNKQKNNQAPDLRFQSLLSANTCNLIPLGLWLIMYWGATLSQSSNALLWPVMTAPLFISLTLAGYLSPLVHEISQRVFAAELTNSQVKKRAYGLVLLTSFGFFAISLWMNFGLWFNLQVPHGDTSMYEEHLWNTLNGKGFRSDLDQGLFLGEHVQVIHLFLLPLYLFWKSHLLLEICGTLALIIGVIPVYQITKRHSGLEAVACLTSMAYLLYFPLQFLDIAIDLKTFRPSAFGIPLMLFAINSAEKKQWWRMAVLLLLTLLCQEDFAIVIAPFGLWLAVTAWQQKRIAPNEAKKGQLLAGLLTCILTTLYLLVVLKVVLPYFRSGVEIHYVSYFQKFGNSSLEVVWNMLTKPALVWQELVTAPTLTLLLMLLVPAGGLFKEGSRLLIGLPLFALLAANELTQTFPGPFHHFHAPMLPILMWAMCVSASRLVKVDFRPFFFQKAEPTPSTPPSTTLSDDSSNFHTSTNASWIVSCALVTGLFYSLSPIGFQFWDSGSAFYWKNLYLQSERAKQFEKVIPLIPENAKVASTDFVHPRFTHYGRSYDYSEYPRRVANYEDKVPDDTEYIVIDTRHRYSKITKFEETREFKNQRDQWEEIPTDTDGYFIVLKRIKFPTKE